MQKKEDQEELNVWKLRRKKSKGEFTSYLEYVRNREWYASLQLCGLNCPASYRSNGKCKMCGNMCRNRMLQEKRSISKKSI